MTYKTLADKFKEKIVELKSKGMEGMILDLRGNPGGYLGEAVKVASQFIPKGKVVTYTIDKYDNKVESVSVGGEAEGMPLVILIIVYGYFMIATFMNYIDKKDKEKNMSYRVVSDAIYTAKRVEIELTKLIATSL